MTLLIYDDSLCIKRKKMSKNARNSRIEFTDLISLSGNLARYSPTGRLLAVAYTNKIIIRASDSLAVSEGNLKLMILIGGFSQRMRD